jgi:hypothetical protein
MAVEIARSPPGAAVATVTPAGTIDRSGEAWGSPAAGRITGGGVDVASPGNATAGAAAPIGAGGSSTTMSLPRVMDCREPLVRGTEQRRGVPGRGSRHATL